MSEATNGGRERAYQALRASEELHRATLNHISDAVFLTDDDGRFTYICPNVNVIFECVPDEVQAMARISKLLGEDLFDRGELAALGEIRNIERDVRTKSGKERHLLIHVKAVSINRSTVLYSCRDITERSKAREELRMMRLELAHSSRLALAGQLLASITHEIKQPLAAIISNANACQLLLGPRGKSDIADELASILGDVVDEAKLATDIMDRLRALVRRQPMNREALDISQLVDETLMLLKGEVRRRRIMMQKELAPSLSAIEADRVSLQQVLLNLIVNAMEAMDETDEVNRQLVVQTGQAENGVELVVCDNGHGLSPDHLHRIFDPFFTTKREGIGLGLVIARSIIEAHKGVIWVENRARGGAAFHVTLPAQPSM